MKKNYKKNACERYQNLSKEEQEKKQQYGRKRYKNLSEDEKQKLVEYKKIHIIEWEKTLYCNYKKEFWYRKFCFFIRKSRRNFWFSGFGSSFWNIRNFWKLELESLISLKYKKLFKSGYFFICRGWKVTSWNIRSFLGFQVPEIWKSSVSQIIRKSFLLRKYQKFLNIRARKFHSLKYKEYFSGRIFYFFSSLGLKLR